MESNLDHETLQFNVLSKTYLGRAVYWFIITPLFLQYGIIPCIIYRVYIIYIPCISLKPPWLYRVTTVVTRQGVVPTCLYYKYVEHRWAAGVKPSI